MLDSTLCMFYTFSRFIVALFPENVSSTTKQRPTTAGSKIKVGDLTVEPETQFATLSTSQQMILLYIRPRFSLKKPVNSSPIFLQILL